MNSFKAFLISKPKDVIIWKLKCKIFRFRIADCKKWLELVDKKKGLEIGGPSGVFTRNNYLPIYNVIQKINNINYNKTTIWENDSQKNSSYFDGKLGSQYICEGTNLAPITNESFDFLLSCNNLEHIANPIKALIEWKRVVKKNGVIILVLPRKESNFDQNRLVTSIDHIRHDFNENIGEDDLTHLEEILKVHDLKRDPHAGDFDNFKKRSLDNYKNRALHHHVFDQALLKEMINEIDMEVLLCSSSPTDYFIAARKKDY